MPPINVLPLTFEKEQRTQGLAPAAALPGVRRLPTAVLLEASCAVYVTCCTSMGRCGLGDRSPSLGYRVEAAPARMVRCVSGGLAAAATGVRGKRRALQREQRARRRRPGRSGVPDRAPEPPVG